jgi:uncharacterized protein
LKPNTLAFTGKDIMLLIICMLCGLLFSTLLLAALIQFNVFPSSPLPERVAHEGIFSHLHAMILINHIGFFILPSVLFFWIRRVYWPEALGIASFPSLKEGLLASLAILFSLSFVLFVYEWNKALPLPDWATSMESDAEAKIQALLSNTSVAAFFINVFLVAVLPALGEEFIFRGILQNAIISITRKPWLAILASATVFSAIHMQFEGFFPRMLLGVLLGYLYVISKNIWLPILAHFINNASQVLLKYLTDWANWDTKALEEAEISGLQAMVSFVITVLLCRYLYVFYSRKEKTSENRAAISDQSQAGI